MRRRQFRERYNEASDRLEKTIIRWLLVIAALLILSQAVLAGRGLSGLLAPISRLSQEAGLKANGSGDSAALPETYVTVRLLDHTSAWRAYLLVNGQEVGTFRKAELVVAVKPGDLIEVDATAYSRSVTFRVVGTSADISSPRIGDEVTTRASIEQLPRVRK